MRLLTIFGTRPEIIRLSLIVKQLDNYCDQLLAHTGQNYDERLSDVFFTELGVRQPDVYMGVRGAGFGEQAGQILTRSDELMERIRPDRILILGDTNSGLAAIVAARRGIPVFHLEAGNRCYDDRVPEEINRRIIDHCSAILMPYTHRSKENLLREGIERDRIYVIGNPISEVLNHYEPRIEASDAIERLCLERGGYFLATLHRAENVDIPERLTALLDGLRLVSERHGLPVVVSLHPRTADSIRRSNLNPASERIRLMAPLGFFDFVKLEKNAACVISDSGTVQEECCIFRVPNVTIRDVTERAETVEGGSNIVSGADPRSILMAVRIAMDCGTDWSVPVEYTQSRTSMAVAKVVMGYYRPAS